MKTAVQIFLKQTRRSKKRLALQLVLLCAAVAFFVVSLNLYHNSNRNLLTVENAYTTIATMEIYGNVDAQGNLVHPSDESSVGYHWLSVEDYDFSPLLALDSVKNIDLRTRVGAYIPGHTPCYSVIDNGFNLPDEWMQLPRVYNTIKFVLDSEKPLVIPLKETAWTSITVPLRILETTNSLLRYSDCFSFRIPSIEQLYKMGVQEDIRRLNGDDNIDNITLYPNVEYVLAANGGTVWTKDPEAGVYIWETDTLPYIQNVFYRGIGLRLSGTNFFGEYETGYYENGGYWPELVSGDMSAPFALQRYEDAKVDPEWAEYVKCGEYSGNSFAVTLTEDIALLSAWHQGAMYLNEGRMITDEEYASGAKVCMVSAEMADYQDWQVGDTLDMHLYAFDGFHDGTSVIKSNWNGVQNYLATPDYMQNCGGFFEEDTYEIVGIFGIREFTDFGDTAPEVFYTPWNAIYIPTNAAPNAPEGPIQPSLITIELKNGSINEFKAAVEEMGLTDQTPGEYEIKFSYFDQGYSKIQPGLQEMNRNAKILLGLSAALLAVTMVLTAFLFSRQHKHSVGILRMLGGSKGQAFIAILVCAAAVVAAGGALGMILGGVLTQSVGTSILGDVESSTVALATGANAGLTILTGLGCIVLFLLLTAIFTATYIGKEPRQLLPEDKG